ncbi:MAG: aminoglycoside 6-adenylyltransferase [Firmicutes bacterium]|nr:aminoglycoside 6-adenylyltransferase [Bacillota bacterium]
MRSEQDMMDLILNVARRDDRIRAVVMNGSRVNPRVTKDIFQDYDIVYLVTELDSFLVDHTWVDVFGERMIMQKPDDMAMFPSEGAESFAYLMQFIDGNRIDLTLELLGDTRVYHNDDKLTVVLLDKDNRIPAIPAPTDEDYWVKPPSAEFFADCCNEFWWVATYVAKGLWRREILYARAHLDQHVRPMLIQMLEWYAGIQTDFSLSTGKFGKYMEKYLPTESWQALLATYGDGSYEGTWQALFVACDLFRDTGQTVSVHLGYQYPSGDDKRVTAHLRHVYELPWGATKMY